MYRKYGIKIYKPIFNWMTKINKPKFTYEEYSRTLNLSNSSQLYLSTYCYIKIVGFEFVFCYLLFIESKYSMINLLFSESKYSMTNFIFSSSPIYTSRIFSKFQLNHFHNLKFTTRLYIFFFNLRQLPVFKG